MFNDETEPREELGDRVYKSFRGVAGGAGDLVTEMVRIAVEHPEVLRPYEEVPKSSRNDYQRFCSARARLNLRSSGWDSVVEEEFEWGIDAEYDEPDFLERERGKMLDYFDRVYANLPGYDCPEAQIGPCYEFVEWIPDFGDAGRSETRQQRVKVGEQMKLNF